MTDIEARRDKEIIRKIYQLFWRGNRANLPAFIVFLLCRMASIALFNIVIPFQVALALKAIISREFDSIFQYGYTICVFALIGCVLGFIGGVAIARNNRDGCRYIQREALANFLSKDYEYYVDARIGGLSSQINQLRIAFNNYNTLINANVTNQVVIIVSCVAIIAWQSWILALVTVVTMTFLVTFMLISMQWRAKYRQELSSAYDDANAELGDTLSHATTVKSFAAENYERKRLDKSFIQLTAVQYRSWVSSLPPNSGHQLLSAIVTVVLLILTSSLYQDNSISITIVLLVQFYVVRLIATTSQIADSMKEYDDLMTWACSAVKTMLIPSSVVDKAETCALPKRAQRDVVFHNVSYRYSSSDENTLAVKDFNLEIKEGERIGLVGYSGSGKTTLTKLLLRFVDVTHGQITIGGVDIRDLSQEELRQHIAYVPQEPLLFHRSIAENIAYGRPTANDKAIQHAGHVAYVDEFLDDLPEGYETLVGDKGIRLSGGQRQRVAIARAILKDAPILVLDEATSALDSRSERYIQKALWELMKNRTALVIAHRLSTIQRMDRIVVMNKGGIVEVGTHNELLGKPGSVYAELWEHQRNIVNDTHEDTENNRELVKNTIG